MQMGTLTSLLHMWMKQTLGCRQDELYASYTLDHDAFLQVRVLVLQSEQVLQHVPPQIT